MADTIDKAVKKAGKARLLADFAEAARIIAIVKAPGMDARWAHIYTAGLAAGTASLTHRAALLTAFGR